MNSDEYADHEILSLEIEKNDIDFDWAFVQWLCIEHELIDERVNELYPELIDTDDFLDEFNIAQEHKQILVISKLADEISTYISSADNDLKLSVKIETVEVLLREEIDRKELSIEEFLEGKDGRDPGEFKNILLSELLPLFYDFQLKTSKSFLLDSEECRNIAFKAFSKILKSEGTKLSEIKKEYLNNLEQDHCFLSLAPFADEFNKAKEKFEAGHNQYLSPSDIEDLDYFDAEQSEGRVDIEILKISIIDKQKFEVGDVVEVSTTQAEKLISLGKAQHYESEDEYESEEVYQTQTEPEKINVQSPEQRNTISGLRADFRLREGRLTKPQPTYASQDNPSKFKYVQAFVLTSISSSLVGRLVDAFWSHAFIKINDFYGSPYFYLYPIFAALIWLVVAIFWYSIFSSLLISKVMPWIWALGGLGVISAIVINYRTFKALQIEVPTITTVLMILSFAASFYTFGWFFRTTKPERY